MSDAVHVLRRLNLANNTGLVRLCIPGHDHWPAHEALVSEKGESQSLLGANGDTGFVDIRDASLGQALLEIVDNVGVVGSAAAHVDFIDTAFGTPAFVGIGKRLSGDASDRCNAILRSGTLYFRLVIYKRRKKYRNDLLDSILSHMSSAMRSPKVSRPVVLGISWTK